MADKSNGVLGVSLLWGSFMASIVLSIGAMTDFYVFLNDFWGIYFYASNMSLAEPQSLYNGFFPIGYPLIVKYIPAGLLLPGAYLLNAIFIGILITTSALLVGKAYGYLAASIVAALIALYPLYFRYANTLGPDIGTAALTGCAVWLLWKDRLASGSPSVLNLIVAGALLGASALLRTHCLVLSLAIIASFIVTMRPFICRYNMLLLLAFFAMLLIQVTVNLLSDHGPFETAQKFNIYKFLRGIDFFNPPEAINESVVALLLSDPSRVFWNYLYGFSGIAIYASPAIGLFFLSNKAIIQRFSIFSALSVILYSVPVALGDSPRAPIPLAAISFVPLTMLIFEAYQKISSHKIITRQAKQVSVALAGCSAAIVLSLWASDDWRTIGWARQRSDLLERIEHHLKELGMISSREVFTDSFDVYFRHSQYFIPRFNGGWGVYSLWGYADYNPQIPIGSSSEFLDACVSTGIKFLLLTPKSKGLAPFLGHLYDNVNSGQDKAVFYAGSISSFKIFYIDSSDSMDASQ